LYGRKTVLLKGVTEMGAEKMSSERKRELRALAEVMNTQNLVPVPITQELLECFDVMISSEEADLLLKIGNETHSREGLASLSGLDEAEFGSRLRGLLTRGLTESFFDADGDECFQLPGILPGWFEHHLSDGKSSPEAREFAARAVRYIESFSKYNVFPLRYFLNRLPSVSKAPTCMGIPSQSGTARRTVVIDVDQGIPVAPTKVHPSWDVLEILDRHGDRNDICLINCFCRHSRRLIGDPCRFDIPSESCISLGIHAGYLSRYGLGRLISKRQAIEIVQEAEKKGAVHQLYYEKHDMSLPEIALCNCCWDCCGFLGSYNRGVVPASVRSFYCARISDLSLCKGCGVCERYCPSNAITLVDQKVRLKPKLCIGCGQCEIKCPRGVFRLHPSERNVLLPVQRKSKVRIRARNPG
jgi:ferredoxin